ncbi:MAG TPA: hypothetical protein VH744_12950 [Terriglobales bacterium]
MRIRRSFPIVLAVTLVAVAVALVVVLRKHAPPEPARLLPGADGFVYINLRAIRRANFGAQLPAVSREPEYEQFVQATGFQFERDLDEAAFAIHYSSSRPGATVPAETRFSEVFVGKIQGDRIRDYLHNISASIENYRSTDIYSIPLQGRTLRLAILGVDTVAASNHDDPQVIHGIVDRSRKLASPFAGPALLRRYYKYVPLTSRYVPFAGLAWAIFRIDPEADKTAPGQPLGLSLLFTQPAVVVASLYELRGVQFRAEAFAGNESEAKAVTEKLGTFLTIFHAAESSAANKAADPDVKQFFDSLKVEQNGSRALLTASLPPGFIRKALAEPPPELTPSPQGPKPAPAAPGKPHR